MSSLRSWTTRPGPVQLDAVSQSGVQIPAGIIEHQRIAVSGQPGDTDQIQPYVTGMSLLHADRHHDARVIMFEPPLRRASRTAGGA